MKHVCSVSHWGGIRSARPKALGAQCTPARRATEAEPEIKSRKRAALGLDTVHHSLPEPREPSMQGSLDAHRGGL